MSSAFARGRLARLMAPALVLAACSDGPERIAAPATTDAPALSAVVQGLTNREPGTTAPNASAGIVFCDLAFRNAAGKLRVRTVPVKLSPALFTADGATRRFACVGWNAGHKDPSALAVCEIPRTSAALEHLAAVFGARKVNGDRPNVRLASPTAAQSLATSADVALYEGEAAMCDPSMIQCECTDPYDTNCGGDGGGEWEGPDPGGYEAPGGDEYATPDGGYYLIDSGGAAVLAPGISCSGRIDNIHRSTHVPGALNVIASTSCSTPISQSVWTSIQRQSCFWIFCWWSTRGNGFDGGIVALVRAPAPAPCQTGWWRGTGRHEMFFGLNYWPPRATSNTYTSARVSWC